ncbi:MAG: TolC family protein [Pirellulaceae bacterium]
MNWFERLLVSRLTLLASVMSAIVIAGNGCANSQLLHVNTGSMSAPATALDSVSKEKPLATINHEPMIQPVVQQTTRDEPVISSTVSEPDPISDAASQEARSEIDLWQALQLGGANGLLVQLAQQRVEESHTRLLAAQANWLPSIRFGVGYNRHDGQLQATHGGVVPSSRNSLFAGGGLGLGQAPLAGGAGGPPRMMINFSLADACFEPLVADRLLTAEVANQDSTFNDAHLRVALVYLDLLEAHALHTNAIQSQKDVQALVKLTTLFAEQGAGSQVEVDRAKTELSQHRLALLDAARLIHVRNAQLVQLLHLEATQQLTPREEVLHPIVLVEEDHDVHHLIDEGLARRPELLRQQSALDAAVLRTCQESWRPWLPNVQVGGSAGTFGGGPSGSFNQQAGRADLDVLAFWEWRNMGIGNQAVLWQRDSQLRQLETGLAMLRDQVAAEVVTASQEILNYRGQMKAAQESLTTAKSSYQRNYQRVRQAEGLPIELLQAIQARIQARNSYTRSVTQYNKAQFRLLRAIGKIPERAAEPATP